jgi:phosphoserine phosphatase
LSPQARGVVAFDLDGTLLRGPTICELLARPLGRVVEMQRFEGLSSERQIAAARLEMARWYQGHSPAQLCTALESATWAPGAHKGVQLLRERGVDVVIASIRHVWPRDKGPWLRQVSAELGVLPTRVAAVGDSGSDTDLLSAASLRFFVGLGVAPVLPRVNHRPGGNIAAIAREILDSWDAQQGAAADGQQRARSNQPV